MRLLPSLTAPLLAIGRLLLKSACLVVVCVGMTSATHAAPGDEFWSDSFAMAGLSFRAQLLAIDENGTVFASNYGGVEGIRADGLETDRWAQWDNGLWSNFDLVATGAPAGNMGSLTSGTNGNVYTYFLDVGGNISFHQWNGTVWTQLGAPLSALNLGFFLKVDVNGDLYRGNAGYDSSSPALAQPIEKWDGTNWQIIGQSFVCCTKGIAARNGQVYVATLSDIFKLESNGSWTSIGQPNNTVLSMEILAQGELVVGGTFSSISGTSASRVAIWDGSTWSSMGSGMSGSSGFFYPLAVNALVSDSAANVYAGGHFHNAGGIPVNGLAKWDGNNWSSMGLLTPSFGAEVYAVDLDSSDNLLVAGDFDSIDGTVLNNIAQWDGSSWQALTSLTAAERQGTRLVGNLGHTDAGEILFHPENGSVEYTSSLGDHIFIDESPVRWSGGSWHAPMNYIPDPPSSLGLKAAREKRSDGTLFAVNDNGIYQWDRSQWLSPMGGPIEFDQNAPFPASINQIHFDNNDLLYVVGRFSHVGTLSGLAGVASWDGSNWTSLSTGVVGQINTGKSIIDSQNKLIVLGGGFHPGAYPYSGSVSSWDGSIWTVLGETALPPPSYGNVVHDIAEDSSGRLYIVGKFDSVDGQPAKNIAYWDGTSWLPLGSGVAGTGVRDYGRSLAIAPDDSVFVGGAFSQAGGLAANCIAQWDGTTWQNMGSGLYQDSSTGNSCSVHSLAIDVDGTLLVTGNIHKAGGKPSENIARWAPPKMCDGKPVTVDLSLGQNPTSNADVILGTPGIDIINAMGGDDTICALGGADIINAGRGADWVDAGDDDDEVQGGSGDDIIYGESGEDYLLGGPGDDSIFGGAGDDTVFGNSGNDLIDGGEGVDGIKGGSGDDIILTGPGATVGSGVIVDGGADNDTIDGGVDADEIRGSSGDDIINGAGGNDRLFGGGGNDEINGQEDDDYIRGNAGHDTLAGGSGSDDIDGHGGQDVISGGSAADTLRGSTGDDIIRGGSGDDLILGGGGHDELYGGAGTDDIQGGGSNDQLDGGADTDDSCDGGSGIDTATAACEVVLNVP